jgi:hypothetical protein
MNDLNPDDLWSEDQEPEKQPCYHRWSYNPMTDDVTIDEGKTGEDHGFAYRIDGGWRILDSDHKKVKDFHIFPRILEALKGGKEEVPDHRDYDFDRLHYGDPIEINNTEELGDINDID